jgi:predicted transcriptional regulator
MELTANDPALTEKRSTFFKLVFGAAQGIVCIAFLKPDDRKSFREEFYEYPTQLDQMLASVEKHVQGHNVYFCPQLLNERKREKQNVVITPNVWSDLDTCHPDNLFVEPSIVVESSPGRYQGYWILERELDPDDAEDIARRIAYKHADQGADRSGWDLTQLLRIPYTYNYKYPKGVSIPVVTVISANRNLYRPTDFGEYPETPEYVKTDIPMPDPSDLPHTAEEILQTKRMGLNPLIWRYFQEKPEGTWSETLWNLQMLLFESGFTRPEVYVICREAACNKYARDGKPAELLWKEVCRAEARADMHSRLLVPEPETFIGILNDAERAEVDQSEDTFIERYIEWASSLGDAAPQYHQAGAFVALSSLLAGSVRLPTSYGMIIPNLWFMILADTTLTRKTTAMDIAMDLIIEIDEDVVMATDGSLEGLLTVLGSRPGKPSVFLRDEFSGLLEQMTKKDYMAGMPELLTKLYDGKMQKRVLRKEVIEVRDPRLIFFAGGIKNKITGLLSFEHVSSGFMPRFVFITAESDINRLRPIGPPTTNTTGNRDAIIAELTDIAKHYSQTQTLYIEKLKSHVETQITWDATMTPEAWLRYNELETTLLEAGLKGKRPEIMTPVGDRLSKSILKAALLLASARQRGEGVVIERLDILRAIKYGEQWRAHAEDVMDSVGKGNVERQFDTIYNAIRKNGSSGTPRSSLMQAYHLSARDATAIFETLEQRGLITRQRAGRTELLLPTSKGK